MRKIIAIGILIFLSIPSVHSLLAQQELAVPKPKYKHGCCCECICDTTEFVFKPINHWKDVKHIYHIAGFNAVNSLALQEISLSAGEGNVLASLASPQFFSWQVMGYDYMGKNFFVGADWAMGFAMPSYPSANYEQIQHKVNSIFQVSGHIGSNLIMSKHLRLYVMGKLQANHINMRIEKNGENLPIPQQAWHRFIGHQEEQIPYSTFIENFIHSDKWHNHLDIWRGSFSTQGVVGLDYRYRKFKFGIHAGYNFQLSDPEKRWKYAYQYEDGDIIDNFKITDVPIRVNFSGFTAGFSFGVLLSERMR
ncbi:hypothetical protein [Thermoflexibacter ruber]|nr:hypothetical protein [Thermoflexibacter ruber]